MKRVAVVLSGCGVFDGTEIHESVLTLLAIDHEGALAVCAAPDVPQRHVVDHSKGLPVDETRNVLAESARIARGQIKALHDLSEAEFDAVVLPGGFGAAKNLCDFATAGEKAKVLPDLVRFLCNAHTAGKPLGFACIAPAIAAIIFGSQGVRFTIGTDPATAKALEKWGGKHVDCAVEDIVVDTKLRIVTTPAYMLAERIGQAETGISYLVRKVLELAS